MPAAITIRQDHARQFVQAARPVAAAATPQQSAMLPHKHKAFTELDLDVLNSLFWSSVDPHRF